MEVNCSHSDYQQIKDQRDNYQQQLTNQEQEIIQRLNTTFNLGLDQNEKDLQKAILEIQELINKPPLTITDETIKQELEKAQQTIIQLQNQLNRKPNTPLGETIKEIIQIDEKLLHENENLKIELNQQTSDYQALAEERNKLVLAQIKEINVQKLCQIIPQAQKAEIQQAFLKANNYEELAQARNKLIVQHINQNSQSQNLSTLTLPLIQPKEERIILISLLVVSLLTIGGLLVKLKNPNKSRSK